MKLKIGDRVKVIKQPLGGYENEIGDIGVITRFDFSKFDQRWPIQLEIEKSIAEPRSIGRLRHYNLDCLSLINSEVIRNRLGVR